METFKEYASKLKKCPDATQNIDINLKNRQKAIEDYHYGPANPEKPGTYWKEAAIRWKVDEATAKSMKCENCAAFDISDQMRACIEAGIKGEEENADAMATIHMSDLGYCNFLHFKCAGSRSCTAWVVGGPVDNKDRTNA